ncbi:MAG: LysR family transcriptional regulator [Telluria sp.]
MLNLNRLQFYAAIVESGSLTRAAERLGVTKAMLSFQLKQLEQELGVALLTRTTRRMTPTEAGQRFFADCQAVLSQAQAAVDHARGQHGALTGTLRVASTAEYGEHVLIPALARFGQAHPGLEVAFFAASAPADLVAERYDVAIRLGALAESRYRAARLGEYELVAVATPAWLEGRVIRTPADLADHPAVVHVRFDGELPWTERATGAVTLMTPQRARFSADHGQGMLSFALAGVGPTVLPDWLVRPYLASGRLVRLLPGYALPPQPVHAVYPDTRHVPAKVSQLIEWLRAACA